MTGISENNIKPPFLSIIIPAFNEAGRLPGTLRKIATYVTALDYPTEVIVVDNLSTDTTKQIILDFYSRYPFIRYLCGAVPGKGGAARAGIMEGRGDYLLICDGRGAIDVSVYHFFTMHPSWIQRLKLLHQTGWMLTKALIYAEA